MAGFSLGATIEARNARERFMKRHAVTVFESQFEAKVTPTVLLCYLFEKACNF